MLALWLLALRLLGLRLLAALLSEAEGALSCVVVFAELVVEHLVLSFAEKRVCVVF